MAPIPNAKPAPIGVNGLRALGQYLYFTNSNKRILGRVLLGGNQGPYEVVAKDLDHVDDFALGDDGTAWVTGSNTLLKIPPSGKATVFAGGLHKLALEGDTSAQFGRRPDDKKTLYITTNGGLLVPVKGKKVAGKVLALKT